MKLSKTNKKLRFTYRMNISKPQLLKFFLFALVTSFMSCSTDDDIDKGPTPEPIADVTLTFNLESAQDQMGDFADQAMDLFDSKVWSFSGTNSYVSSGEFTDEAWYSVNGANWVSNADDLMADARRAHTMTNFNGKLYIIGGEDSDGNPLGDIWKTENGTNWSNPFLLAPFGEVSAHQTIVYNGKMYVIAGDITTGNTKVWSTPNGDDWSLETNNAFSGRGGHRAVVFNGAIYVIGGENIAGTRLNEIWVSTNGSTWTEITTTGTIFSPRGGHTATTYNNKVWVIGGRDDGSLYKKDIWYSSNMSTWTKYDDVAPFDAIAAHATLKYDDALWVFGGYKSGGVSGAIWSIKED